jgi:hypothetical protein
VNKHVLTVLSADEPKTLGVVEPLNCSLFHVSEILVIDFERSIQMQLSTYNLFAEIQFVSNDVEMLARRTIFPPLFFTRRFHIAEFPRLKRAGFWGKEQLRHIANYQIALSPCI